MSIFAFEGIGVILPIKEILEKQQDYFKVVVISVSIYGLICVIYAEYALFGFGADKTAMPMITEAMPRKSPFTYTIKILFCLNVIIMTPLMMFPITRIVDSYTVAKLPASWTRTMIENSTRTILVAL